LFIITPLVMRSDDMKRSTNAATPPQMHGAEPMFVLGFKFVLMSSISSL
jgi:hypothetical protein